MQPSGCVVSERVFQEAAAMPGRVVKRRNFGRAGRQNVFFAISFVATLIALALSA
jgi:hypothetical protein